MKNPITQRLNLIAFCFLLISVLISCSIFKDKKPIVITPIKEAVEFPDYQRLFKEGISIEEIDIRIEKSIELNKSLVDTTEGGTLSTYKRWRSFWVSRQLSGNNRRFGPQAYLNTMIEFSEHERECTDFGDWNLIGPKKGPLYNGVELHTMGAVFAVAADPNNLNVVYAGTGSGGIWKTNTALSSNPQWENITDYLNLPTLGVSDIVIHPNNSQIIYAATSEMRAGYGFGIIKSTDGGTTWESTNLAYVPADLNKLDKILINPENPDIIYTHSKSEVFKTMDGGENWPSIYVLDPPPANKHEEFRSMELNLSNPDIVYMSSSKLFRYDNSVNEWQELDFTSFTPSTPSGYFLNTVEVELSGVTDGCFVLIEWVYPHSTNENLTSIKKRKILKYSESTGILTLVESNVSSFAAIFIVNPSNPEIMYLGDSKDRTIQKSRNGGISFTDITEYRPTDFYNGVSTHADIRAMKLLSASNNGLNDVLLVGDDGGILLAPSENANNQKVNWGNINGEGLTITEYYGIGGIESEPYLIQSGTQDNGFFSYDNSEFTINVGINIGDCYDCVIDRENSSNAYGQTNYPRLRMTSNRGQDWGYYPRPSFCNSCSSSFPASWKVTKWPLVHDANNVMYVGHYDIYKYNNGVDVIPDPISDFESFNFNKDQNLIAIDIAKSNTEIIYAAFPYPDYVNPPINKLFKTENGGDTWEDITPASSKWKGITSIVSASDNPNKVWITFDQVGDLNNRVNYSNDGGSTWHDISNGLPPFPVNCITYQEDSEDLIYVGTDIGVYYHEGEITDPENPTPWKCFNNNFPATLVSDLEINYCAQKIRAATFGRGLWESPLLNINGISIPDSDGDGICDTGDQCLGLNDMLIGTPCDDGDICTINDIYDSNCNCAGTPYNSFNLMIQDNPLTDLGIEPNTEDIWNGNIWNCSDDNNLDCSITQKGNPEYKIEGVNNLRVKINNIGCTSNTEGDARLHLYWTIGRPQEFWTKHWLDMSIEEDNHLGGISLGGEITPLEGLPIPSIPSGGALIMSQDWMPPNPADFSSISEEEPMICFLARIESTQDPILGETIGPIAGNVRNSNNIATINETLVDIDPFNLDAPIVYFFYLNNPTKEFASVKLLIENLDESKGDFFKQGSLDITLTGTDSKSTSRPKSIKLNNLKELDQLNNIMLKPGESIKTSLKFNYPVRKNYSLDKRGSQFKLKLKNEISFRNRKVKGTEFLLDINVKRK